MGGDGILIPLWLIKLTMHATTKLSIWIDEVDFLLCVISISSSNAVKILMKNIVNKKYSFEKGKRKSMVNRLIIFVIFTFCFFKENGNRCVQMALLMSIYEINFNLRRALRETFVFGPIVCFHFTLCGFNYDDLTFIVWYPSQYLNSI